MSTSPAQFSSLRAPPSVEIKDPGAQSPIDFTKSPTPDAQPLKIIEFKGEKTGTHIVGLKDGVSMDEVIDDLFKVVKRDDAEIGTKWESINTFSGALIASHSSSICNVHAES